MKLAYNLTESAFRDFNIYHVTHSPSQRRAVRLVRLIVPAVWLLAGVLACNLLDFSDRFYVLLVIIISVLGAVMWFVRYPRIYLRYLEKTLKKWAEEGINREFVGDFTLELQDGCLRESGAGRVTEVAYDNVERLVEDKDYLYIYIGSMTAVIVPKTAFSTDAEREAFTGMLREKCGAIAGPRG